MHASDIEVASGATGARLERRDPARGRGRARAGVPQPERPASSGSRAPVLGRRAFLLALAAGLAHAAAGRLALAPPAETARAPLPLLRRHPVSAAAIGARYLRAHPGESAAVRRLAARSLRAGDGCDGDGRRRALRRACARDFAEGRVVRVDGFVLSRTEARLCAAVLLGANG
jgi:hypothetical protein